MWFGRRNIQYQMMIPALHLCMIMFLFIEKMKVSQEGYYQGQKSKYQDIKIQIMTLGDCGHLENM